LLFQGGINRKSFLWMGTIAPRGKDRGAKLVTKGSGAKNGVRLQIAETKYGVEGLRALAKPQQVKRRRGESAG